MSDESSGPLPIEDQVRQISHVLASLPQSEPLGLLHQQLPCSFSELSAWIARSPDPTTEATMTAAFHEMPFIGVIRDFQAASVGNLDAITIDDPRIPALMDQLRASWPSQAQVQEVVQLFECAARTLQQMIAVQPKLPPDSTVAAGLTKASGELGMSFSQMDAHLASVSDTLTWLATLQPGALQIVHVGAPAINYVFAPSGQLRVSDTTASITLAGTTGSGFLQCRLGPTGEAGTRGYGLIPYLYRVTLDTIDGDPSTSGISSVSLPFGLAEAVNYDGNATGQTFQTFAVTSGALGSVAPSSVEQRGSTITFHFDPPVRIRQSSVFFGLASWQSAQDGVAEMRDLAGNSYSVSVRVPISSHP